MTEPLRDIFIRNLKFYRKQKHYSQEKLSYAIDMSMNYINQLENKSSFPPPEIIDKIARILEIRPVQLFDENASPENIACADKDAFIAEVASRVHGMVQADILKGVSAAVKDVLK